MTFCDPDVTQSFSLRGDNRLVYDRTGQCVGYKEFQNNTQLSLFDCGSIEEGFNNFLLYNDSFLITKSDNEYFCITPKSEKNSASPCLNDPVVITTCSDKASQLNLLEETYFQLDRQSLSNLHRPIEDKNCDFKACGMNKMAPPIQLLPTEQVTRCRKHWECVTVAVKTSRRPYLIIRLAQSIRDSFGYDLPIACYDDGPGRYLKDVMTKIAEFPLLNYVIGDHDDYGIAEGRNRALSMVQTKYFLLLDDDVAMLNTSDLKTMVDILDTTDAAVVGGSLRGRSNIAGLLKFGYFNGSKRKLGLFPGTCDKLNRTVPNFPSCFQCELNLNLFMGKTELIRATGGWDPDLKVLEHKDIFIRIKAAGLKLAICKGVLLDHDPPQYKGEHGKENEELKGEPGYMEKRRRSFVPFRELLPNRYNVQSIFIRREVDVDDKGNVLYFDRPDSGHC